MNTGTANAITVHSQAQQLLEEIVIVSKVNMPPETEWILIKDAAELADMHIESVRRLCRKGSIQCRQLIEGVSTWEVDKASLIAYLNSDKSIGGRPPKN